MAASTSRFSTVMFWVVTTLVLGLFVYSVSAAVGNWIGMAALADLLADGLAPAGIAWLTVGVSIPVVFLVLALLLGRSRERSTKLLILFLGLALVAVMQLNIMHLIPTTTYLGV